MQEITNEQEEFLEKYKDFFLSDMKVKDTILSLAPTELDDYDEENRIKYVDKLYKELDFFKSEFTQMSENLSNNQESTETIRKYFEKVKQALLISKYEPGTIQKLYQSYFSNMSDKLIEDTKEQFSGHTLYKGDLNKIVNKTCTINELLHVFHSYVTNNNEMMEKLPVLAEKQNAIDMPITLYGEENELSKKLFKDFPLELDCDTTHIVSLQNKILMMIRGRGHALTLDIDTTDKTNALIKYFVPKLCNRDMIEALPGINKKSISENGATGLFQISYEEMNQKIFDFIEKVPTDKDMFFLYNEATIEEVQNNINEKNYPDEEQQQEEIINSIESTEENSKNSKIKEWSDKIKNQIAKIKNKISNIFKKEKIYMLNEPTKENINHVKEDTRQTFQTELRNGNEKPIEIDYKNIEIEPKIEMDNEITK